MDKILGLGTAGCNIASMFEQYPQYEVYKVNSAQKSAQNFFHLEEQPSPEMYEKNFPDMSDFLEDLNGDLLFVVCGASKISAASLRILQQLKGRCEINVLYMHPNIQSLSEERRMLAKMTFNVFQQYARSGVFNQMYIVSNEVIEDIVGGIPVMQYYNKINEVIVSAIHMINIFNHTDSITDTFSEPYETARISTFGLIDVKKNEEKAFFLLDNVREKQYYYAIETGRLNTDEKLHKKITDHMASQEAKSSYGIFSTDYENDYGYFIARTSTTQDA
tara:strand:+ start:422 stop:1249 length:828 start_codon:yes stop_codon:yes gene_type:complete